MALVRDGFMVVSCKRYVPKSKNSIGVAQPDSLGSSDRFDHLYSAFLTLARNLQENRACQGRALVKLNHSWGQQSVRVS